MNALTRPRDTFFRISVAAAAAGLILLSGCSSDDEGAAAIPTSSTPAVSAGVSSAGVSSAGVTSAGLSSAGAAPSSAGQTDAGGTAGETSAIQAPAEGGDVSTEGVCAFAAPGEISGLLQAGFNSSSFLDVGTVPECTYFSNTALSGATIGYLEGGGGKYDEQVQIAEMTSTNPTVSDEKVNGNDAKMFTYVDMTGYPGAKILMAQGEDLLTASVTGAMTDTPEKVGTDAKILLGYLTSKLG